MKHSNLAPGITESDIPGWDDEDRVYISEPLCDDCGCSYSDHETITVVDADGNDGETQVCPEVIGKP